MIFQPNLIAHVIEPLERGLGVSPLPLATHHIGRTKYPLVTSRNSSVFLAHYAINQEPFSGPVKRLVFLQLGSCETPNLFPFERTCNAVEFNGHIHSVDVPFKIITQLPKANKVTITVGPMQQYFEHERYEEFFSITPPCPSVKKLFITMDLDYFYSFQHRDCSDNNSSESQCSSGSCLSSMQFSLISLVESILKHSGDSFPNLKTLTVELPENDRLCAAVQSLIRTCPGLRSKTKTSVQNVAPCERNTLAEESRIQAYSPPVCPELMPWPKFSVSRQMIPESQSTIYQNRPCSLPSFSNNMHLQQENSSPSYEHVFNISNFEPQMISTPMNYRPPPGFTPFVKSFEREDTTSESLCSSSGNMKIFEQDIHQRVHSWLRTLEK